MNDPLCIMPELSGMPELASGEVDGAGKLRQTLLELVDRSLDDPRPEILALVDERAVDDYALWAALTALTQEVKVQNRSFKHMADSLAVLPSQLGELGHLKDSLEARERLTEELRTRERERARDQEARLRSDFLDVLLDLRERLARSLAAARTPPRSCWWERWLRRGREPAREWSQAVADGLRLTLERLESVLSAWEVEEVDCLERPFDPHTMQADEVEVDSALPEGTVLSVLRPGYRWKGRLHRPAHVRVSRKSSA